MIINIDIRDAIKVNGQQSMFITFDYDPKVVSTIKKFDDRNWNSKTKEWELNLKNMGEFINSLPNYDYNVTGFIPKPKEEVTSLPENFKFKTTPFAHQLEGIKYGLNKDCWLLGDEMGLGKTLEVIAIAVAKKYEHNYKHCLIVCGVNGLKWNWVDEVHKHSFEEAYVLGQRKKRNGKTVVGSSKDKLYDVTHLESLSEYFIITNIETLRNKEIAKELASKCATGEIGLVAVDECHMCKNNSSQQAKGLLKLKPKTRIAMTGTPIMNKPLDIYVTLKWLGYERHNFSTFKNHYCNFGGFGGYEIVGYKNLSDIRDTLKNMMLRRLKGDVFDLPEKLHIDEYVEMTGKQEQIYKEIMNDIQVNIDQIQCAPNPLAQLIRLRQATGYTGILSTKIAESAKLDRMEEIVQEAVDSGKKVVIFSNWTAITEPVVERLYQYKPAVITGETPSDERQEIVNQFQNDPSCTVIVGTIGAMGTGLTLTAGTVEIFLDEPWNRAKKEQAEDRCHRVGTTENITIYTLLCKGTIDERIHDLVEEKGAMADVLVDGKLPKNKTDLLNFLIS